MIINKEKQLLVATQAGAHIATFDEKELGLLLVNKYKNLFGQQLYQQVISQISDEKFEKLTNELHGLSKDRENLPQDVVQDKEIEEAYNRLLQTVRGEKMRAIIKADKLHLTNILHNLVDNATKYCKDAPNILLKTKTIDEDRIQLQVIDNGIGISKDDLVKVFEKFYRVPTGDVHDVKGFGLGLFYTKNICDAHGWKISIESEQDKGTTVTIII